MKTVLRIVAVLVLLAAAAAGWAGYEAWTFLKTPPATPGQEAFFDVEPGANVRRVADKLEERGLITDARKFLLLARYKKWDSRLQAGRFALNTGWLPEQVLDTLVNGQPVLFRVTVPEGLTWWQTAKVLEEAGLVRFEDFRAVITDPAFLRHYGIPFDSAEGFLMPDTYLLKKADVPDKAQARAVAGRMVDNFWRKGDALWPDGKRPSRDELRRLVILASVVEKETAFADERPSRRERDRDEDRRNKVVNIHATTQLKVVLVKPERFENASEIADHLKEKRTVVINLESTNKDIARRLIDFLSGVAYAGEGKIKKVAANTYIITPYHVDIMGDLIDELENNGLYL